MFPVKKNRLALLFLLVVALLSPALTSSNATADDAATKQKLAEIEQKRRELTDKLQDNSAEVRRINGQQQALAAQVNDLQNKISELVRQQHQVETELTIIEGHIEETKVQIALTEAQILQSQLRLASVRAKIVAANQEMEKTKELLANHVRLSRRLGTSNSHLDAFFGSADFSDFLARLRISLYFESSDEKLIEQIKILQQILAADEAREVAEKMNLENLKAQQEEQKAQLAAQEAERKAQLAFIKDRVIQQEDAKQAATDRYAENARLKISLEARGKALVQLQEDVIFQQSVSIEAIQRKAALDERVKGTGMPKMIWPLEGPVSSWYGWRVNPFSGSGRSFHNGIDIAAPFCAPVKAMADGVVTVVGKPFNDGAEIVMIAHTKEVASLYAHLTDRYPCPPAVHEGQQVKQGDVVAYIGSTGQSTGPHLHFMLSVSGKFVDPAPFLP